MTTVRAAAVITKVSVDSRSVSDCGADAHLSPAVAGIRRHKHAHIVVREFRSNISCNNINSNMSYRRNQKCHCTFQVFEAHPVNHTTPVNHLFTWPNSQIHRFCVRSTHTEEEEKKRYGSISVDKCEIFMQHYVAIKTM